VASSKSSASSLVMPPRGEGLPSIISGPDFNRGQIYRLQRENISMKNELS